MAFRFEKLDVWHKALEFANTVYQVTQKFPPKERFGLTNQMRRASVSISANLAEGVSRSTTKEKSRFVEIAYGSLMEVVSESYIAKSQGWLDEVEFTTLIHQADDVARMLSGLKASFKD